MDIPRVDAADIVAEMGRRFPLELEICALTVALRHATAPSPEDTDDDPDLHAL